MNEVIKYVVCIALDSTGRVMLFNRLDGPGGAGLNGPGERVNFAEAELLQAHLEMIMRTIFDSDE